MPAKAKALIAFFKTHGGILRFSAILKAGFHPDSLIAIEREGAVEKIGQGLYRLIKYSIESYPDLVTVSVQTPRGVICLLSALAFHEATNEIPKHVDIAIPRRTHANWIKYPPVKFYQFAPSTWEAGIITHKIEGHKVRIYNLAKTIADCFKFRNRIGANVARDALKIAVTEKGVAPQDIMKYAKICRVSKIVQPILETMI